MSVEEKNSGETRSFPKQALGGVAGAIFLSVILELFFTGEVFSDLTETAESTGGLIFSLIIAVVVGFVLAFIVNYIAIAIHFVFVYFPTKWISKESHVHKHDMWKAFFYAYAIMSLFNLLTNQTILAQELWFTILTSVLTVGLFLLFYFNEGEKKSSVKKGMLIAVSLALALNIGLTVFGHSFANNILEDIDIEEIE